MNKLEELEAELTAVKLTKKVFDDIYVNGYTEKSQSKYYEEVENCMAMCPVCDVYKLGIAQFNCNKCFLKGDIAKTKSGTTHCTDWASWQNGNFKGCLNIIKKCSKKGIELVIKIKAEKLKAKESKFEVGEPVFYNFNEVVIVREIVGGSEEESKTIMVETISGARYDVMPYTLRKTSEASLDAEITREVNCIIGTPINKIEKNQLRALKFLAKCLSWKRKDTKLITIRDFISSKEDVSLGTPVFDFEGVVVNPVIEGSVEDEEFGDFKAGDKVEVLNVAEGIVFFGTVKAIKDYSDEVVVAVEFDDNSANILRKNGFGLHDCTGQTVSKKGFWIKLKNLKLIKDKTEKEKIVIIDKVVLNKNDFPTLDALGMLY